MSQPCWWFHHSPAVPKLEDLMEHVTTFRWFDLGLALGVRESTLQVFTDRDTGRRGMFENWLSSCEQPSWDNVIQALRKLGENRLAAEISGKF